MEVSLVQDSLLWSQWCPYCKVITVHLLTTAFTNHHRYISVLTFGLVVCCTTEVLDGAPCLGFLIGTPPFCPVTVSGCSGGRSRLSESQLQDILRVGAIFETGLSTEGNCTARGKGGMWLTITHYE